MPKSWTCWLLLIATALSIAAASPTGELTLSVYDGEGRAGEPERTASLTCDPDGGSHPNPAAACEELWKVDGRIEDKPTSDGVCPMVYDPVTLHATGNWRGEPRQFERTYGNRCEAQAHTGPVFAF